MKIELKHPHRSAIIMLLVAAMIMTYLSLIFIKQHQVEPLYPSEGLTEIKMLSEYFPGLKDTPADTEVYIYRGEDTGVSALVLGGTHTTEPSGTVGAALIVENAIMKKGTLFVIPRVNKNALTCSEPQDANPLCVHIETPTGTRFFRIGSRLMNPTVQWPDPDIYYHNAGQLLTGKETRNVDRVYPGRPDGNLTEKLVYGIVELIKQENIDVELDLHEGPPEYPTIDVAITHQNALNFAGDLALNLSLSDVELKIDASPENLHGFSHREIGDATDCMSLLVETVNPIQGRIVGKKNEELVLEGHDKFYEYVSANSDRLYTIYDEEGKPLNMRVARQVETVNQLIATLDEYYGYGKIEMTGVPSYSEIMENGMGTYLAIK